MCGKQDSSKHTVDYDGKMKTEDQVSFLNCTQWIQKLSEQYEVAP
jgi:hypothetical protein